MMTQFSGFHFWLALACLATVVSPTIFISDAEAEAQANYDEAKMPPYKLPDPLVFQDGSDVAAPEHWARRRAELLKLFEDHVFGASPGRPDSFESRVVKSDRDALGGAGQRDEIEIKFHQKGRIRSMRFVLVLPTHSSGPVPVFIGMHLFDSKAESPQLGASLAALMAETKEGRRAPTDDEKKMLASLPAEKTFDAVLRAGYGVGTIDAEDVAPDDAKRWTDGVVGLFLPEGQKAPAANEWGAIGAWAWGLSRALDYLETDDRVDARRVIAIGHSRMGKTALWAGARDERFAMVVSNNSGCGGAALSRRIYGETVKMINDRFPHWFCGRFKDYNDKEDALPVDQHELLALIAPRPLYVASAEEDRWADPHGEYLSCVGAEPVYRLLGRRGLGIEWPPTLNESRGDDIGYHLRLGPHALSDFDWMNYTGFADATLRAGRDRGLEYEVRSRILWESDEAAQMGKALGMVWREGNTLFLQLEHPATLRSYTDRIERGDGWTRYQFEGWLRDLGCFQVHMSWSEEGTTFLIDEKSGQETYITAPPIISPDHKRFATPALQVDFGLIGIWRNEKPCPKLEWEIRPKTWRPTKLSWKNDHEIEFSWSTNSGPAADKEFVGTIRFNGDKWECSVREE